MSALLTVEELSAIRARRANTVFGFASYSPNLTFDTYEGALQARVLLDIDLPALLAHIAAQEAVIQGLREGMETNAAFLERGADASAGHMRTLMLTVSRDLRSRLAALASPAAREGEKEHA